jgi:hypothetical protein
MACLLYLVVFEELDEAGVHGSDGVGNRVELWSGRVRLIPDESRLGP